MRHILVTGGAGFVGSALALGLRRARPDVVVTALDNLKRRGSELNLPRLKDAGIAFVHGDIRVADDLDAVRDIDLILECSAEPSVLAGYGESPAYVVQTNLGGTVNCLELARRRRAAMIFLSTSRVYPIGQLAALRYHEGATRFELLDEQPMPGASSRGVAENFPLEGSRSMYGATKLCSELLLHEYAAMYGMKTIINRCGVLAGPWQMGKVDQGVVSLWVARHIYGGKLQYIGYGGTGKQLRDVLHIDDLLDLVLHQIDHLDALSGKTFNVGGGTAVSASLLDLTALCREVTGNTIDIAGVAEDRAGDVPIYLSDHSRVSEATGWQPQRDVRQIVQDIAAWITEHRAELAPVLAE